MGEASWLPSLPGLRPTPGPRPGRAALGAARSRSDSQGLLSLGSGAGEELGGEKERPSQSKRVPTRCLKTLLLQPLEVVHQQPVQPASDNVRSTPNHPRQARSIIAARRGPA